MTDEQWLQAARDKFGYPNPIMPVYYTSEAWKRKRADKDYKWQEGDLARDKTKSGLADLEIDVTGL